MKNLLANSRYIYKQTKIYQFLILLHCSCIIEKNNNHHNNYITWKANETIN